jgi:hypothetical protein
MIKQLMKLESMEIVSKSRFSKQLGRIQMRQETEKLESLNTTARPTGTGCFDCLLTKPRDHLLPMQHLLQ